MPKPILSARSKIPAAKADKLLRCYAERLPPAEAAQRSGLSLNTVYEQYSRIRWRLMEVGYYRDAALSKDEDGLSDIVKEELRRRRGLEVATSTLMLQKPSNGRRNGRPAMCCATCARSLP